jgi:drug/metabolite transporter (DMT)-like permease
MKFLLPVVFASVAAIGNALFAYGQKQASTTNNGLLYVSASALLAGLLALLTSPTTGPVQLDMLCHNWKLILISGGGLFLTYLGFNLLYSQFGVAPYVLYAVISILTTVVVVGYLVLKEPVNGYQIAAIITALITVILFSLGQKQA